MGQEEVDWKASQKLGAWSTGHYSFRNTFCIWKLGGGNPSLLLVELLIYESVEIWVLQILVLLPA